MDISLFAIIIFLMFFHWLADFVLQTRWMAETKSSSWLALSLHCLVYSFTMAIGLIFITSFLNVLSFAGLIFVFHFITDAVTSRMTTKYYNRGRMKKFWMTIGFDQWLHVVQILLIYWIVF